MNGVKAMREWFRTLLEANTAQDRPEGGSRSIEVACGRSKLRTSWRLLACEMGIPHVEGDRSHP